MQQFKLPPISLKTGAITVGILFLVIVFILVGSGFLQKSFGLSGDSFAMNRSSVGMAAMQRSNLGGLDAAKGIAYLTESEDFSTAVSMPPIPVQGSDAPAGESKIIKSASLALLVRNVDDVARKIDEIRVRVKGQPGNSSFSEYRAGSRAGDMTIWVPSDRFDETLTLIKDLALRVNNENVTVSDVSAQFVDIEARLKNFRATEAQYVEIMKRSGKINEVLDVTRELSNTRSQIEQLQGQMNYLSRQIALSSIHVSLAQEASPSELSKDWRPLTTIKAAAKKTLSGLTDYIDGLLVFLIALPLFLLKLAVFAFFIWAIWSAGRFVYRRMNVSLPAQS